MRRRLLREGSELLSLKSPPFLQPSVSSYLHPHTHPKEKTSVPENHDTSRIISSFFFLLAFQQVLEFKNTVSRPDKFENQKMGGGAKAEEDFVR